MFGMTKKEKKVCSKCDAKLGKIVAMEKGKTDYKSLPKSGMVKKKRM